MNNSILILNFLIPFLMIYIGYKYKTQLDAKFNKFLDIILAISVIFSGLCGNERNDYSKLLTINKKYSSIWIISGISTFLISLIVLIFNRFDVSSVSIILFEIQCAILVTIFITIQYLVKVSHKAK